MNTDNWISAVLALRKAKDVVVFTGAGISAESGIPTFRDDDGFWKRFPPERFASWKGLLQTAVTNPRSVADFVMNVIEPIAKASPNAGHLAVSNLQRFVKTTVVTQNIDGLHQSAGSKSVLEIHGSLLEVVAVSKRQLVKRFDRQELAHIVESLRKYVDENGSVISLMMEIRKHYPFDWLGRHRPNLILFGDALAEPAWSEARQAVQDCEVIVSVGTSGAVYPAAMLPLEAAASGSTVIAVDPHPSEGCWLQGKAGDVLPKMLNDAFDAENRGD